MRSRQPAQSLIEYGLLIATVVVIVVVGLVVPIAFVLMYVLHLNFLEAAGVYFIGASILGFVGALVRFFHGATKEDTAAPTAEATVDQDVAPKD